MSLRNRKVASKCFECSDSFVSSTLPCFFRASLSRSRSTSTLSSRSSLVSRTNREPRRAQSKIWLISSPLPFFPDCRNPQTFQQGLLLISTLARLVPALVLQNVLPIFISVGANAVQRDDAYTFRVVEKVRSLRLPLSSLRIIVTRHAHWLHHLLPNQTIESIIPVMISQRREETADRLQLWNRSSSPFFHVVEG